MPANEPSLPTLPHSLPVVDVEEDDIKAPSGSIEVAKGDVDDRKSRSLEGERGGGDVGGAGPLFVSSISKDEPIVTRQELWSYYCAYMSVFLSIQTSK